MMERVISATEARVHFGEVMRRVVETGQPVIVEKAGEPQVVLLSMELYEHYKVQQHKQEPEWKRMMREAHEALEQELGNKILPPAEEIIRQMREERNAYLNDLH